MKTIQEFDKAHDISKRQASRIKNGTSSLAFAQGKAKEADESRRAHLPKPRSKPPKSKQNDGGDWVRVSKGFKPSR